jgi:hypothetical protein|tara:strand:+ start:2540 stop:2800 length:261 start_codon:yes stop_codon:yes gene_type:complete
MEILNMREITLKLKNEIIEKVLSHDNVKEMLSDIFVLDRFVTECKFENDDWVNGKIYTNESLELTDIIWEEIGGDNLYKNRGWKLA